jgi:hypothetical protein
MTGATAPVCRYCGSDQLHAVEREISWRYVDWQYSPAVPERVTPDGYTIPATPAGWHTGDEWGDTVGDSGGDTVGIVCGDCGAQVGDDDGRADFAASELITTRGAYIRAHPVKPWRVAVQRITDPGDTGYEWGPPDVMGYRASVKVREPIPATVELGTVTVNARDAREALEKAGQSGMVDGRYPWRPAPGAVAEPVEAVPV